MDLSKDYTEEDMVQIAMGLSLKLKIEIAIDLVRSMEGTALQMSEQGFYLAFSGGKDSIVLEKLFQMAGVKYESFYNNTTIDPPELIYFIKKHYPHVKWNNVGAPLPIYMARGKGPPTRIGRWCCEIYKEHGGDNMFKAIGVRAQESSRRKGLWKNITKSRRGNGLFICPILYWTDDDIWNFIRQHNMPYCSLYDEGWKRLGCIGCPLSGTKGQDRDFARWPKYEALWKKGFQMYWDNFKGKPRRNGEDRWIEKFNSVSELWQWWRSGKALDSQDADCQTYLW